MTDKIRNYTLEMNKADIRTVDAYENIDPEELRKLHAIYSKYTQIVDTAQDTRATEIRNWLKKNLHPLFSVIKPEYTFMFSYEMDGFNEYNLPLFIDGKIKKKTISITTNSYVIEESLDNDEA